MEREGEKISKTSIACIHDSIIINILSYLPAETVIRCRFVCKNWATLISTPDFAQAYSSSGTTPIQFLLHGSVGVIKRHRQLVLADLAEAFCNTKTRRYDYPVPINTESVLPDVLNIESSPHELRICSACNFTGFITAYAYPCNGDDFGHPYHIFNPITTQHIIVQQNSKIECWRNCALLLAHKTNQLKLLKFFRLHGKVLIDIQTIGTNLWRRRTGFFSLLYNVKNFGFPCFLNGIYHWGWSCLKSGGLVCFDPDEEAFHHIPTPQSPWIENYLHAYLGLLDGCLCICRKTSPVAVNDFEFWVMNEYGVAESWIKKLVIPKEQFTLSEPLKFWKYGEMLVLCDNYDVICYNPRTGNRTFIAYYAKDDRDLSCVPIPYVPNFKRFLCS